MSRMVDACMRQNRNVETTLQNKIFRNIYFLLPLWTLVKKWPLQLCQSKFFCVVFGSSGREDLPGLGSPYFQVLQLLIFIDICWYIGIPVNKTTHYCLYTIQIVFNL
jgi:hypothetical protein